MHSVLVFVAVLGLIVLGFLWTVACERCEMRESETAGSVVKRWLRWNVARVRGPPSPLLVTITRGE